MTIRGPETKPTIVPIPQDAEFIDIQFRPGVCIPGFPSRQLVDRSFTLPESGRQSFWFNSSVVEVPVYDNVGAFIDHLARKATGLTQGTFRQFNACAKRRKCWTAVFRFSRRSNKPVTRAGDGDA